MLKQPWDEPYEVELKVRGKHRPIYLNGGLATLEHSTDGPVIRHRIVPETTAALTNGGFDTTGAPYLAALGNLHPGKSSHNTKGRRMGRIHDTADHEHK
jgi:hypothetical protein